MSDFQLVPACQPLRPLTERQQYAAQVESGVWPQDQCSGCQGLAERLQGQTSMLSCCQRYVHHHLDCCLHCGTDERDARRWGYRGRCG